MYSKAAYIWLDGEKTQKLRSKTRILDIVNKRPDLSMFPEWSFDGSSTYQATGEHSDLILHPVNFCRDPFKGEKDYLVLCEVLNPDKTPHITNTRNILSHLLQEHNETYEPWIGFEQEYTLFSGRTPLGWPDNGFPRPQGPFYCGVGSEAVFGRDIVSKHMQYCLDANLSLYGTNAEVMPGQWEFQIGYRGFKNDLNNAINFCDHLHFARWILCVIAEEQNVVVSFDNKPIKGDWNGAGCHTNFSTKQMRDPKNGMNAISASIERLSLKHKEHIALYGEQLSDRLTGAHETCSINTFVHGIANRAASIRIPQHVASDGYGYLEDRRPGANCDPYLVASRLIATICDLDMDFSNFI